jgi:hypothetical protein
MDVTKLSQGEKIAAGSAIALFVVLFLSWFGVSGSDADLAAAEAIGVDTTANAWQSFDLIDIILFLTILAATIGAGVKASGTQAAVPFNTIAAGLGALSTVLVLYRVLDPPHDADRKFGLFLGLILAAGVAYGAYMAMQEEGATFQDAADRFSDAIGSDDGPSEPPSAPPPPPPPPPPAPPPGP